MTFHIAQCNIARLRHPEGDPRVADFFAALDTINALAERSPGFVWRYMDESGAATDTRPFEDPEVIVNLSVWDSVDSLRAFTYRTDHVDFFRRRSEWFTSDRSALVLWWVPAGHLPSVEEAMSRLDTLATQGPTEEAFTFARRFPVPGG